MLIRFPRPSKPAKTLAAAVAIFSSATACNAQAIFTGVTGAEWASGSNWTNSGNGNNSYPSEDDFANLDTTANLSFETPNNIRAIRIGTSGSGTLQIGGNSDLRATATPGRTVTSVMETATSGP